MSKNIDKTYLEMVKKQYGPNTTILDTDEKFKFTCVACGDCCKNRTGQNSIILSPYDIFNLKKNLGLSLSELYKKHLVFNIGSSSGMPMFYLGEKTTIRNESLCTFLKKEGTNYKCSVHKFKPVVCSVYPLGRVVSVDLKSKEKQLEYIFLGGECSNKNKENIHYNTINEWVNDKEITEKIFIDFSDAITSLLDIIKMNKWEQSNVPQNTKDQLIDFTINFLYDNYDTNKDFLIQFNENIESLIEIYKIFISINKKYDDSIVSEWKDFYDNSQIASMLLKLFKDRKVEF